MASAADGNQTDWNEGMSKLVEAARHNMTASNLAIAGAVALGAAAFTYFWDTARRNQFMETSRRFGDGMTSFWGSASASPSVNQ